MPRRLSPEELNSIAMQVFVQEAAEAAAAAAGLHLRPGPLDWDGGTMQVRRGPHRAVLGAEEGPLTLEIPDGAADDDAWQSQVRAEIAG